jgi:LCCL domain
VVRALLSLVAILVLALGVSTGLGRTLEDTWSGTWDTEWGKMALTQSGAVVAGTYTHDSGHINGRVSGRKLIGRWTEAPTRKGPSDAGAVELTMSNDGKRVTGRWTYDGSPTAWNTNWSGTCTAGRCLQNAGAVAGSTSSGSVEPKVWGADWDVSAIPLRNQPGSRFVYVCPASGRKDQVWGTRIYSDNSSVCSAALHAGAFTYENGGIVTIEHLPGQSSYTGSTQNGITSASLASWPGSFQIIGADNGSDVTGVKMGGAGWTASATRFRGQTGGRYRYICPGGAGNGGVYGTNTYTDDSSVCTAAVLQGLLTFANGGRVTIQIAPAQSSYSASRNNGVSAQSFGRALGSFVFPGAAPIPPGGGGGGTTTTTPGGGAAPPPTGTPTGTVLVNGRPFTGGPIPYNATVDVTNGRLLLKADVGSVTVFGAGVSAVFKLLRGTDNKKPIVEMRLVKGDFSVCPKRKPKSATRSAATVVRQIWGDGKGSFRTNGRYATATVRGTIWLTADRCDGTFVKVDRGVIQVNDRPARRQVTVRAPQSYLARP